jgi:Zn-dependent peptidase ImmA (M78 family)
MPLDLQLFGKKLQRYRGQLELALTEVSAGTGISEDVLNALENGEHSPSGDEVLILADYYKCDYKFFLSNERLTAFEQTDTLFRRFGDEFSKQDRWAVLEILYLADAESYLQSTLGKPSPRAFPFHKVGNYYKGHGEQAAGSLRTFLGYSEREVRLNVYEDFRALGIHVFRRHLTNSNISGVYVKHPLAGPCILVNYSEDIYRQRFTAAHEAAHAILDQDEEVIVSFVRGNNDLREIRANTFASQYLMPPVFLHHIPEPRQWTTDKAIHWANALKVSTEALAIALSEAGFIDNATMQVIRGVRVPRDMKEDPELPETLSPRPRQRKEVLLQRGLSDYYVRLCFEAYREELVSAARLAEILLLDGDTELRDLADLYGEALRYGD